MIEWINSNKEWLFSGIGVAILSGLVIITRNFFRRAHQKAMPAEQPKQKQPSSVKPEDIYIAVRGLPPFQRDRVFKEYVGIQVSWKMKFSSASESRDDNKLAFVSLVYKPEPTWSILVYTNLELDRNKQVTIAHTGADVRLTGKIINVDQLGITIAAELLEFL